MIEIRREIGGMEFNQITFLHYFNFVLARGSDTKKDA